jgi:hypothetical protein
MFLFKGTIPIFILTDRIQLYGRHRRICIRTDITISKEIASLNLIPL